MLEELGISFGTALVVLIALYFVIKWGVKNGIKAYFEGKEHEKRESCGKAASESPVWRVRSCFLAMYAPQPARR